MPLPVVLASSSPYRMQLLRNIGLAFEASAPAVDESVIEGETAEDLVRRLSVSKARAVAAKFPGALIIGSDQVADYDGSIVGKPIDHTDAVNQLTRASGRAIVLYTGVALLNSASGRLQVDVEPFQVTYRTLDAAVIERYLRHEQPYNCCGSLKSEGAGIALLEKVSGNDPNALIGLPLIKLCQMLRNESVELF